MSSFYKGRRKALKIKHVEAAMVANGCSQCGYDSDAAALRAANVGAVHSPIRLAHDDASIARIDKAIKKAMFVCQNCYYERKAADLRERYS